MASIGGQNLYREILKVELEEEIDRLFPRGKSREKALLLLKRAIEIFNKLDEWMWKDYRNSATLRI